MVTTAPPQYDTYRARVERAIRRRDVAAWTLYILLGVAVIVQPSIAIQNVLGDSPLSAVLGLFFITAGTVGLIVRLRNRFRAEKIAFTLALFGIGMYIVVLLSAATVGYPSAIGLVIAALLLIYLDRRRLEVKVLSHASKADPATR